MTLGFGGWNAFGILAAVAIAAGSILLVVYALRRGLVHRDLDGTIVEEGSEGTMPAAVAGAPAPAPSRTLGVAGVTLLVAGIALALIGVATTSSGTTSSGPGKAPTDCAQSWDGCPQATANPQATPNP